VDLRQAISRCGRLRPLRASCRAPDAAVIMVCDGSPGGGPRHGKVSAGEPGKRGKEKGMSTSDDLKEAFAGESQANRKYLAFAKKADEEGYGQVARLFRAAADAETVHAHAHLGVMGGVNDTAANLKDAIGGETHEFTAMYPAMIEEARKEGNKGAIESFENANAVEQIHAKLYQQALDALGDNNETVYYVCQHCGNTVEGEAPERCPICGRPKSMFKKVD
jgi:rubrerythrin